MKYKFLLYPFFLLFTFAGFAQPIVSIPVELNWKGIENLQEDPNFKFISFEGSRYFDESKLPYFFYEMVTEKDYAYNAEIKNPVFIPVNNDEIKLIDKQYLPDTPTIRTSSSTFKGDKYLATTILPIILQNDTIFKLSSFELVINKGVQQKRLNAPAASTYANSSVLSKGTFFKVRITESGMYRLSYEDLRAKGIDPSNVRVFGYGGTVLDEDFSKYKPDDLPEIPAYDNGNSILFYAQGINKWTYNKTTDMFFHQSNSYSKYGYYFVTSSNVGEKRRIAEKATVDGTVTKEVTTFLDYQLHEKDSINIINSGKEFYGEMFNSNSSRNFRFNFPNICKTPEDSVKIRIEAITTNEATYSLKLGNLSKTMSIKKPTADYERASSKTEYFKFSPTSDNIALKLNYSGVGTGYLNFIEVSACRELVMSGHAMFFNNAGNTKNGGYNRYHLTTSNTNIQIWDVTDPTNVERIKTSNENNKLVFIDAADEIKSYVAINTSSGDIPKAEILDAVPSQNIHGMGRADMLIITHPMFVEPAKALAKAHLENSGLIVEVVTTEQVYNEFSSGTPDASAYRWAAKMFYDRPEKEEEKLKHLLLFGKGSFDNRGIMRNSGQNLVLTYQASNSVHETRSFVTDDYFALMDDEEGPNLVFFDKPDIGIGRFPTKTEQEAWNVVNKTIEYMNNKEKGNWKNQVCYLADDGGPNDSDFSIHMRDINGIADNTVKSYPSYQVIKLLTDAYQQEVNASGERYPAVNTRLQNLFRSGLFSLMYMGHGGTTGWANEQLLMNHDIKVLKNKKLPIVSAGTCNFSTFDKDVTSGGEEFLLNPIGGSIGTFSAARTVYVDYNEKMMSAYNKYLFHQVDGEYLCMGDIILKAKRETGNYTFLPVNNLSYVYFGDPALKLNYPSPYKVTTTEINGKDIILEEDTLKALSVATIKGIITDQQGNKANDFNGYTRVVVFDKEQDVKTLMNDKHPTKSNELIFKDRPNTIYTGKAKVTNGNFEFTFMLPKDIRYNYGTGRMNFYACDEDNNYEGQGYCENFIVGGSSDNYEDDQYGPDVKLYLNHEGFISGSRVNETPLFIAKVYDKNGINTSGAGTGHDIILQIDELENFWFNLNEYFETDEGGFQSGRINFVLSEIPEGKHTLTFRVWDLLNNSTTKTLDFVVVKGLNPVIFSVSNYPNPATEYTHIYINHDRQDEVMEFTVEVYDFSGRKVWSFADNSGTNEITWNIAENSGGKINPGVYIYRVSILTNDKILSTQSNKIIVVGQ